ncbi:NADPH:elemental sulfur oxidoreductase [Vulcanisaeta moutnovskia 768-28]|uniref:NADPH:elemental sulfur oxidoreductase n=1 Tax=Vulcanisaeta moutnovskia (strain 768-28) TaxID=985053 RepID=F0QX55_VULM7|nr:FAD-dependent oxidoreductase [Vulcanisaeta moutnovskia]ADY02344.1 NADPH:elemental sulfur oxidoreductase [Vulcanisaeta moutnovskia 768-28]
MKVVVIGGGAAGMSAASRVKKLRRDANVVVLEGSNMVSHAPCGIPYYLEGLFDNYDLLMHYTPDYFRNVRNIDVRLNDVVVEVGQNYVRTNKGNRFEWDYLVLAMGAIPITPGIPIRGDRVFTVHHPAEAMKLRDALYSVSTIGIIGTGYVGLEVAEALRFRGKNVIMIGRSGYPLRKSLDEDIGNIVKNELSKYGVKLRLNEIILEISDQGDEQVIITDGGKYVVDAVILATGIRPNIELARQLSLRIGETGAVWVDEHMRTSIDNVYAAGDIAETRNLITNKPYWHPFGTTANKMGFVVGSNIAGKLMIFPGVVGTSMTRFMNLYIASTGLTTQEAIRHGFRIRSAVITARTKARYYPGGGYVTIKLIVDDGSMRLIGAQVLGDDGSYVLGKIDTLAALMAKGATVEDLFMSDLAYLPAVTQVWDPLIIAARQFFRN